MAKRSIFLLSSLLTYLTTSAFAAVLLSRISLPAPSQLMTLEIVLAHENTTALLEEKLKDISDPRSVNYGKWLTREQVDALFAPPSSASAVVRDWLTRSGVRDEYIHDQRSTIRFTAAVRTVNRLLSTSFGYYDVAGSRKLRTTEYSVPDDVARFVQLIHPTTFFGQTVSHRVHIDDGIDFDAKFKGQGDDSAMMADNCTRLITPPCLRSAYNIGSYVPDPTSGSRIGFGSFLNESARLADLHIYQRAFGLPEQNFTTEVTNGGVDNQAREGRHSEANLDAQFQNAMSYPLPQVQFITGGKPPFVPSVGIPDAEHNTNEPYHEYYSYLLSKSNEELPQVISNSYGDDEQTVPYAKRVCAMIGMLGLRGITVLESSGDTGIGAACISNDGKNRLEFTPGFPASCPYVTTVGGTEAWDPEVAWIGSSGGFSNYFDQPWYQQEAVDAYMERSLPPETRTYYEPYTNFSGRAYPDISAHSLTPNYLFYTSDGPGQTGGTSAAAPVVAGVIALLNDARLKAGKPTMGFINPFLYGLKPGTLFDITTGKTSGCNGYNMQTGGLVRGGGKIPWASWNGTVGWDPATGLGMPDFQRMMTAALS
ncbi:Pro-kumamolisin [Xylariaceae sp. FL0594]|nr:Pro-kumamolisin [Xylariaceae sp. FL0594]